jgi:hypothetical protein
MSFLLSFGLSAPNRMRIRVQFWEQVAVGFRARFVYKVFRVLNLYHTPWTAEARGPCIHPLLPFVNKV